MTRVLRKKIYPDILADYVLCSGCEEDCTHLFACTMWVTQGIPPVDATPKVTFWDSIWRCSYRKKE